ncbi:MAG TPA: LamG domain-containing protein, partial [Herpetosiphonaceae bacterium]|nr:LamG domain-containing protein [Herpetosiphonaceae bacterium]
MDDLRAYTVTLSASQIQQLYSESAPIMRFSFDDDERSATTVVDDSVNAYPGALKGSTCNTVTVNRIDFTHFGDDGVNVRLQNSNELIASIPTITQTVTTLNASASFCGDDALYFEAISGNSTDNFGTISLTPASNGATATADAGYLHPIEYLTANYTYGASYAGNAPALADGKIGNKLVLDGRGAVEVSGASAVSALNSTFTIMGWINPDDVLGFQQIIASGTDASFSNGFSLALNGDDLQFRTLGVKNYNSSASVNDGVWQHVAVVFDSGYDVKFYVNGVLADTELGTAAAKANTDDPTYLGGSAGVTGVLQGLFRGQLDEITVYDREL